jgi:hypothetical protein
MNRQVVPGPVLFIFEIRISACFQLHFDWKSFRWGIMKNVNANNFAVSIKVCSLVLATFLLVANLPVLAQQDMSNMPGMSKSKPKSNSKAASRKRRKTTRRKQTAKKRNMNNLPGMNMPAMHRRRAASRRRKAPAQKSPANKNQMGDMPGMKMPAKPSSSPTQSPAPQLSPQQMQMNVPGMQMPTASPNPQASPQQKMETKMPMPAASPSPGAVSGMPGMKSSNDASKKAGMGDDMSPMGMDPYFTAINYPVPRDTMMVMLLSDFQSARTGPNFFTGMAMVQYGVTSRWTVGLMAEGQKIFGLPTTYGGFRINSYFRLFPHDHLLNFTLYGEYEGLNGAALYKMEVAGFGGEDLDEPLAPARRTPVRTFEARAIMYHDWKRVNLTFNFISETDLKSGENDFGYAWGVFRQPAFMAMERAEKGCASGVIVSTAGLWDRNDRGARQHS